MSKRRHQMRRLADYLNTKLYHSHKITIIPPKRISYRFEPQLAINFYIGVQKASSYSDFKYVFILDILFFSLNIRFKRHE